MIKIALTALPLLTLYIRSFKRRIISSVVAAVFVAMAFFWGSVAGFLALVPLWGAPAAAGAVSGGFLLLGLLVKLIFGRRMAGSMSATMATSPGATAAATTGALAGASSPTLLAALLAGYMAGKNK